jgi:RHS repeat-associated protein
LVNRTGVVKKHEYYYPYGGNRGTAFSTLTTKRFTGQYHEQDLPGGEGLSYYNARWYDAQLGRFVSADTLVPDPGDPQALNRLAYTRGNPLRFVDPTGHVLCIDSKCDLTWHPIEQRPKLRTGIAPRAISYIHGEMTRNATSAVSQVIWGFNAAAKLFYHPRYFPVQEPISQATAQFVWASQVLDARLKKYVGPFAPLIGNWDHKPILTNKIDSPVPEIAETGQWSTVGDLQYRFDIWSNIHYGYVGRAANFTGNELINGAGVEQIGSDIYNKNTPSRSSNAPTWRASWDDPSDTAAIQIGIDMWNRYGLTVTTADLYLAVLENPRLTSQPIGGSQ